MPQEILKRQIRN